MAKQYTKELIRDVFWELAGKNTLKDVTVSEIAKICEINRNTFYYYYEDIYDLMREILDEELEKVDIQFNETLSWEDSFLVASEFILKNKKAVYNIFKSVERKTMYDYVFKVAGIVMTKYVENESKIKNIRASKRDKDLISYFYQAALTSFVVKWIDDGMVEEPESIVYRIGCLFDGNIEKSLRKSEELNN
ncbi:MAG: TetR-like C-terminal domain-containing protein [Peptoniphilus sp.]|uniref:TetR/AcrR family transcriptional regulator n=1 Tax=Peptoniphilus sp. TaxID=1971214 RepID=UPI002A75319B|nr:TetR-like C-terminal domain-containing protein [Peptoniphilus sp.]MDY2986013.1 TetR-like C-terminal domain-containing protein [Peptoniphilus sp.]